ncbi:MAG TPA: hypothetical protein PKM58_09355 [Pyrinomonadaceae bacterium]|nr:hypothetical protein [Pyrinomonadaceae bacterium]HNU07578.1 hypothetical protein [Pyrinomonadaceae bacterium]
MRRILIVMMLMSFAGCSSTGESPGNASPVPTPVASPSIAASTETAESEKAKEEVVTSARKLKDLKFWSAKTEIEGNPALSGEIQYIAPDRFHFKQGGNEAIVVGDQTFAKENGKWVKADYDMSGFKKIQENALTEEDVKKIQNVQVLGEETLNGKRTTIYVHRSGGPSIDSVTKMWIDRENGLVMKSVVENRVGKQTQRIVTTYDFDTPVTIEAPKIGSGN